jgi:hypothetical protein
VARLVGETTARIRQSLDVEMMLKTAAQEIRQALGLPEVVIRLISPPDDNQKVAGGHPQSKEVLS